MKTPEAKIALGRQLAKRLYPLAWVIGILISLVPPATYYVLEFQSLGHTATIYAQEFAGHLHGLIMDTPSRWKSEARRYNQLAVDFLVHKDVTGLHVRDEAGQVISGYTIERVKPWWSPPARTGSAPLLVSNGLFGRVEVEVSQNRLVGVTLILWLISTTLGAGLAIVVYRFPVRVVGGVESQIRDLVETAQHSQAESERLRVAAQASEQWFRDLVQGLDAIVWEADPGTGQITFVSHRAEAILGYPIERWLHEADFWVSHLHAEDREEILAARRSATAEDGGRECEYRMVAADGRVVWFRDIVQAVENEEGRPRLLRGVTIDVTERRRAEATLLAHTGQLEAIRAVTVEITRELELTKLLALITRRATELVGADMGAVFLWDEEAERLAPSAWCGLGDWMQGVRLRLGEGTPGTVAEQRQGILINDYRHWPKAHPLLLERTEITTALAEPLVFRERLVGAIVVHHGGSGRAFAEQDREILALFAAQAAIAIENARLHGEAVRQGEELSALLRATRTVMAGLDLRETLDRIVTEAAQITGIPHVKVLLADQEAQVLRLGAVVGRPPALLEGLRLPWGTGHSGIVAATGQPLYVPDCPDDPRNLYADQDRELGILTYLGLPIKSRDEVLGVLTFNTTEPRRYSPAEVTYLASFADQAAIAIENARLYEEAEGRRKRLATLVDVARRLTRGLNLPALLDSIAEAAALVFGGEAGFRLLEGELLVRAGATAGARLTMKRDHIRIGESLSGRVAATGEPIVIENTAGDTRLLPDHRAAIQPDRTGSLMCVPIRVETRILRWTPCRRAAS